VTDTVPTHPEPAERLRAGPPPPPAVEELLRFPTPVPSGAARTLLDDVEIEGTTMPKGDKVLGMIISANRDESGSTTPTNSNTWATSSPAWKVRSPSASWCGATRTCASPSPVTTSSTRRCSGYAASGTCRLTLQ
jgi:Cytochrome P450